MPFDTPIFLFYFLPAALVTFFVCSRFNVNLPVLAISLVFYAWGEPLFVFCVLISAVFDWSAMRMFKPGDPLFRTAVALCVAQNVGLLVIFKYANFVAANLQHYVSFPFFQILLPLGISFIAFEKITYVVDIARRVAVPARSLLDYLAYVFLFPKLIAGPIVKYHDIAAQLYSRTIVLHDVVVGATRACFGLAKKVLIADNAGDIANLAFSRNPAELSGGDAWIGAAAFALQIYFDFSGYSDIAIGLARVLGFRLQENFNYPYLADNFTEFWRRWHISLSSWIREYVYIPLGGNRLGAARTYANLWIAFLLSGAWHGANWTFILWGAYHGFFLAADKLFWLRASAAYPALVRRIVTLVLVMIGWVLFRAPSAEHAGLYLSKMIRLEDGAPMPYLQNEPFVFAGIGILLVLLPWTALYWRARDWWTSVRWRTDAELAAAILLLVVSIGKIAASSLSVFIYFRF